jgi:beta-glucosidase-like glycosyl hydrolase
MPLPWEHFRLEHEDLVFETGYRIGKDLKQNGIHLNFAPVADINTNPKNPVIGYRSFGPNKEKVSRFALAMYQRYGESRNWGLLQAFSRTW